MSFLSRFKVIFRWFRLHKKKTFFTYLVLNCLAKISRKILLEYRDPKTDFHQVVRIHAYVDSPVLTWFLLELSLLRSYCVPSVSKLLYSTQQLSKDTARRYVDTDLLLREISENKRCTGRPQVAIQRINEIHSQYNISNDDFKYVLGVFYVYLVQLAKKVFMFDLPANEKQCFHNFWRQVGLDMHIKDIPLEYSAMETWWMGYEHKYMKYHKANQRVAAPTLEFMTTKVPDWPGCRAAVKYAMLALMDPKMKVALGLEREMSPLNSTLVLWLLRVLVLLYNAVLPIRPVSWMKLRTPKVAGQPPNYASYPFYKYFTNQGYNVRCLGPEEQHKTAAAVTHHQNKHGTGSHCTRPR